MIPTIVISLITIVLIILSLLILPSIKVGKFKIDLYWVIALLGAIILLISSLSPSDIVIKELTNNTAVNPLKIITLFFSMTIISIFLDEVGLFKYLAAKAVKKANNNQFILFFVFYVLISVLTIFTSNDVVILTFTPFICFFCKNSKVNPIPYLVLEFAAANTWSTILMIGNPTNIYLASNAGITFFEYVRVMAIPTLVGGIIEFILLIAIFYKKLKQPLEKVYEEYKLTNKPGLIIGVIHLAICLIFLTISSYLSLEMYLISLVCALSLIICILILSIFNHNNIKHLKNSLLRLPYPLIPFFLSMFVIVVALNHQGVTTYIATLLNNEHVIYTFGYSSYLASNVINNIPMSILYSTLCNNISAANYLKATYASIIGSNIGAFLTPIGALAGIMFTSLVNKHDIKYSFLSFLKYGVIISIPVITGMLVMLDVVM